MTSSSHLPISPNQLRLYGRFWDVMSIVIFIMAMLTVIGPAWPTLTWPVGLTIVLLGAQAGLYVQAIMLNGWPIKSYWLTIYFLLGPALWLVATYLTPSLFWLGFVFFGQMYGLLPPRLALPGTALISVVVVGIIAEWQWSNLNPALVSGFTFQWLGGASVYWFIYTIARTSAERAKLITQLEATQKELEAARQSEVELATLQERERLARELHDNLGHTLVALSVQLEAVQRLYRVDPDKASAQIDELKTLTRHSMADLRRALDGLRAPGLGSQSLTHALQNLSVAVGQRANLHITCTVDPQAEALPPAIAEILWRVAQEALTNIEKHARAHTTRLEVAVQPGLALLRVSDDGVGLPPNAENQRNHYGLRGMRERVEGLGGTLTLLNTQGTTVEVRVPLIHREAEGES